MTTIIIITSSPVTTPTITSDGVIECSGILVRHYPKVCNMFT